MRRFTTIDDVVNAIHECVPELVDEPDYSDDVLYDIVHEHFNGRYEDMTTEDFRELLVATYIRFGADEATARVIVGD